MTAERCKICGFALYQPGLKTIMCCCTGVITLDVARLVLKRCLDGKLDLFDMWDWASDIDLSFKVDSDAEELIKDISLSGAEWSGYYGPDDEGLRWIWQSLYDIGCAPFHWRCDHDPKHEVTE